MEQGPTEKFIIEQCIRNRMPLPEKIKNAPMLELGLELYYVAFLDLNTCRHIGFGEGPIPWAVTRQMADEELGLEDEQREDLFYYVAKMDTAYLEYRAKETEKKANKGS